MQITSAELTVTNYPNVYINAFSGDKKFVEFGDDKYPEGNGWEVEERGKQSTFELAVVRNEGLKQIAEVWSLGSPPPADMPLSELHTLECLSKRVVSIST